MTLLVGRLIDMLINLPFSEYIIKKYTIWIY
jgi:hypothetical protein